MNIVSDDLVNSGLIEVDQSGPGVRLADHLRTVATNVSEWADRLHKSSAGRDQFVHEYDRFGYRRQVLELFDSARGAGLGETVDSGFLSNVSTFAEAKAVITLLVEWADEIDRRRDNA